MKLYATIESERGGRPAKKGGDVQLDITLALGNKVIGSIELRRHSDGFTYVRYYKNGTCTLIDTVDGYGIHEQPGKVPRLLR